MEFKLDTESGMTLEGNLYKPEGKPSGIVIIIHGLGEYFQRYADWASRFTDKGVAVAGIDLPGHGRSPGRRGHIRSYEVYNSIIDSLADFAEEKVGKVPVGLYGHSLGGNIALNYLLTNKRGFRYAIITSPWLKLVSPPSATLLALLNIMDKLAPGLLISNGLKLEDITRSEDAREIYDNDQYIHGKISVRLAREATEAAGRILDKGRDIDIPVLLLHGEADRITSASGSEALAGINSKISLKLWEDGYHELHNEPLNDEVFSYIYNWMVKL